MQLSIIQTRVSPGALEFEERLAELNLVHYASEAAEEMEFSSLEEFGDSVKRAMELCISAGIPIKGNFKRIYKCSVAGIVYDWKLSVLAYKLVCLNGKSSNPCVAHFNIQLLKDDYSDHQ